MQFWKIFSITLISLILVFFPHPVQVGLKKLQNRHFKNSVKIIRREFILWLQKISKKLSPNSNSSNCILLFNPFRANLKSVKFPGKNLFQLVWYPFASKIKMAHLSWF